MEEIIKKDIMAIVPKYIWNKGNCTLIYTRDEIIEVEKSIKTVIKNIAKYYHLDLRESNNTCRDILCTRKNPPIPFTHEDIFILIKTRKPIGKHDGAYGYVSIDAIEKIEYKEDRDINPRVLLKNGEFIHALCTLDTLHKARNNGKLVRKILKSKAGNLVKENPDYYLNEDRPATKGDIALLFMEIAKLKSKG